MKRMLKYKNNSIKGTQTQKWELYRSTSSKFLTNLDSYFFKSDNKHNFYKKSKIIRRKNNKNFLVKDQMGKLM